MNPDDPAAAFPPIHAALTEPDGLLAAGGDLSSERLLYAYRMGIFPWYQAGQPILWWSPDPRCILRPAEFHIARRLRRSMQKCSWRLTFNRKFSEVIHACAGPRRSGQGTWITNDMAEAFESLHRAGWAHSVEIHDGKQLVGGMYGLAIGRVFFGESMFSHEENASKYALLGLCSVIRQHAFELIDCQVESGHLLTLGAVTVPRARFRETLDSACEPPMPFEKWPAGPISVASLRATYGLRSLQ
ncbi:MAG: leucyl/phenylalanyl-tRNA--protein transferase [Woeseiaceae bacterium]|nr:leucyl/phenylalanyl-tRNA--protein transferase [Woeseiaceae bacterium]